MHITLTVGVCMQVIEQNYYIENSVWFLDFFFILTLAIQIRFAQESRRRLVVERGTE